MPEEQDVYLAMAMMAQSGADLRASFERFAELARNAWPDVVSVERGGFFSRGPVHKLVLRLPGHAYIARREGIGVHYEIGTLSHGVIIRTDRVHPDGWVAALRAAIAAETTGHLEARNVLDNPTDLT